MRGADGSLVAVSRLRDRTSSQNGLAVNGSNSTIEQLRDLVARVVRDARAGARVVALRREENDMGHFPLEWATFYVDYFEEESLSDTLS